MIKKTEPTSANRRQKTKEDEEQRTRDKTYRTKEWELRTEDRGGRETESERQRIEH